AQGVGAAHRCAATLIERGPQLGTSPVDLAVELAVQGAAQTLADLRALRHARGEEVVAGDLEAHVAEVVDPAPRVLAARERHGLERGAARRPGDLGGRARRAQ